MSKASATACAARKTTDQAFRQEIAGVPDDAARLAIINAAGFDETTGDGDVIVNALTASDGEVSDAQLAGGIPEGVWQPNVGWNANFLAHKRTH